ncbi:glycosyltransferase [Candidatus Bipolaricaulota bacterium]|nr:glycosyltransferase [Candidatus Bipolaricaulota bacterium]
MNYRIKVSVIILTYKREDELAECIESILGQDYSPIEVTIIDNGDSEKTRKLIENRFSDPRINYFPMDENRGVAGGRNEGVKRSNGEIMVFIDDDALFRGPDAITQIMRRFADSSDLGVISFKSLDYESGDPVWQEIPLRDKSLNLDEEQETSYYLGGACAIRKEVFDRVGLYSDKFVYAFEELDLSFRIVEDGYRIIYFPTVAILHKNPPERGDKSLGYWEKMLENRIRASVRNLPWRYVFFSGLIWSGYILLRTKGRLDVLARSYGNLIRDRKVLLKERNPISFETITKLKNIQGRVLY